MLLGKNNITMFFGLKNILPILEQTLRPKRFLVMIEKLYRRFFDVQGNLSNKNNLDWITSNCSDFTELAYKHDPLLWEESLLECKKIEKKANEKLKKIDYKLGGGGAYPILYFITRYTKPLYVVETGVAAGYSSFSFLSAIDKNGVGRLYSSDFPYFRIPSPEKLIGFIVDESLKSKWELYIDGDKLNLPKIVEQINRIDIFHYDSDKSYKGREVAINIIKGKLHNESIFLMDDIQDNSFFYDYINKHKSENWNIFKFEGKFVGMIGKL